MDGRLQNEIRIDEKIDKMLLNLPDFMAEWNENMKASKKTATTRMDYISFISRYLKSINDNPKVVKVSDFNEKNVEGYMIKIQIKKYKNGKVKYTSDSYQSTMWSVFKTFFEFLIERGYIEKNYIYVVKRPKNHDIDRINAHRILLTSDDFNKLISEVKKTRNPVRRARNLAMLLVLMNTGMRETAMFTLMPENIDLEHHKMVVIDKGNKRHEYILTDVTVKALKDWMSVRDQLCRHDIRDKNIFITHEGKQMDAGVFYNWIREISEKALGKPISAHKIRSGLCSILYEQTHDIEFVRRAIGHADLSTTQRYIVTDKSERRIASEIIDSMIKV